MKNLLRSLPQSARFGVTFLALFATVLVYGQCPPPTPTANPVTINCGNTATLTASGGNNYTWYSNAAGTTQVGTGASYTTPAQTASTTYYVASVNNAGNVQPVTFNFTGNIQTYTVPPGVTSIIVDARGAGGGNSGVIQGGQGGRIVATIPVV